MYDVKCAPNRSFWSWKVRAWSTSVNQNDSWYWSTRVNQNGSRFCGTSVCRTSLICIARVKNYCALCTSAHIIPYLCTVITVFVLYKKMRATWSKFSGVGIHCWRAHPRWHLSFNLLLSDSRLESYSTEHSHYKENIQQKTTWHVGLGIVKIHFSFVRVF